MNLEGTDNQYKYTNNPHKLFRQLSQKDRPTHIVLCDYIHIVSKEDKFMYQTKGKLSLRKQ